MNDFGITIKEEGCPCGKSHRVALPEVICGRGVISAVSDAVKRLGGKKAFVLADPNTYDAAGRAVCRYLEESGISYALHVIAEKRPVPGEKTVGSVTMHFDCSCDTVIAVGSGVINDVAKIVATRAGLKFITVATAPSMDGYASATSSVILDDLKQSLATTCPKIIIGDTDVLCRAPHEALISGLGDMIAKYISICEWRISHIVTGEYYCEAVASLVRGSLEKCVSHADGLISGDPEAAKAVFSGLVTSGLAMNYAGMSRPASGVEHYFSHIWDMRAVSYGDSESTHGIQCAIATLITARMYEDLVMETPDIRLATENAENFDSEKWYEKLHGYLGKNAEPMIALDRRLDRYSPADQRKRFDRIAAHFDEIKKIVSEEIPPSAEIERLLDLIGCPKTPREIGIDESKQGLVFAATKDIRDKYILSTLLWDMGLLDRYADRIEKYI